MSDQEQYEIIKKLRTQVVKVGTRMPDKPAKADEQEIIQKAKEAGDTLDDDSTLSKDN